MSDARDHRLAEDAAARERALDVTRSFLVQAPAGSGKTELLIQRLLALLGRADRPERVLAITFTRKAAGEMRDRVIGALAAAQRDVDEAALRPHERRTRTLALAVLAQDARHGWHLARNPSRLAIRTIDSLAQAIALQAPLSSRLAPGPRFTEDPTPHYLDAAHAAIAAAAPDDPRWNALLWHLDNDADALAGLLAGLLAQREQWLLLARGVAGDPREALERTLAREVAGEFAQIARTIAAADFSPFARIAAMAIGRLDDRHRALREVLEDGARRGAAPPLDVAHAGSWRVIAGWLMTKDATALRRSATGMPGVPPIGQGPGIEARRAIVKSVEDWLAALEAAPGLSSAFATLLGLPPLRYTDDEWDRIASMLALLPELADRLTEGFAASGEIDFAQATLAALQALGSGDEPSDLLLRLDLRVEHVLVDEFQDTSYAHLELLRRLVSGWSPGDGRTLFAVGDPMQSIYRFRGAEVRAFVDAQATGEIEGVDVERLTLRRNFRSQAGLVDWVNQVFPRVLGDVHDPWRSRVAFADAVAVEPASDEPACTLFIAGSAEEEAGRVVEQLRAALAEPGDVAVLVRARSHLLELLPALRAASIPYTAVDLDTLADRPAARDLVALTHAIVQPADRLAWLAVLRAPWCGLTLADLHVLVLAADRRASRSIEAVALDPPGDLSPDGAARLAKATAVLARARRGHRQATLAARVREAWMALGGPATLDETLDLAAVEKVFIRLAEHERAGDLPDWSGFVGRLAVEKLSPPPGDPVRVQVMTMYKAKGLEFDTVILPGLGRARTRNDTPLVRWRTRRHGLMVGLARARGGEHDGVYEYLRRLAADEDDAELARLAYVACTRAKRRLALIGSCAIDERGTSSEWKSPERGSILRLLDLPAGAPASVTRIAPKPPSAPGAPIERLPSGWQSCPIPPPLAGAMASRVDEAAPPFDWARERARRLGVVVHGLCAQIACEGASAWPSDRLAGQEGRVIAELIGAGALPSEAASEAADVRDTVARILEDERGRWLLDPAHAEARSEWALTGVDQGEVVRVVLDRTFVVDGVRWIVDVKTGTHEGGDPQAFLDAEVDRYQTQLARYARIVAALDPTPIRLALYHPRVPGGWREVPLRTALADR